MNLDVTVSEDVIVRMDYFAASIADGDRKAVGAIARFAIVLHADGVGASGSRISPFAGAAESSCGTGDIQLVDCSLQGDAAVAVIVVNSAGSRYPLMGCVKSKAR